MTWICVQKLLIILLGFASVSTSLAAGAKARIPREPFLFVTSPTRNLSVVSGSKESVFIEGFSVTEVKKFLMIANGPMNASISYQFGSSFLDEIGNDYCHVANSQLTSPQNFEAKRAFFKTKNHLFNTCLQMRIQDASESGLIYPAEQIACKIERLDNNTVIASGGLCFFGVNFGSAFSVAYEIVPGCQNAQFAAQNAVEPADFSVFSGFYLAGDASGSSLDLAPLDATELRILIEAGEELPLSLNYGQLEPRWPAVFTPDVHMGSIRVGAQDANKTFMDTNLLVSNLCSAQCLEDKCANPCNFMNALGTEMRLYELKPNGTKTFLDLWYTGGVIPAQWEGFLPGSHIFSYNYFKTGKRFRLEADLRYPDMYYRLFKNGFNQFTIDLAGFGTGGTTLPALSPFKTKTFKEFPLVPQLPSMQSTMGSELSYRGPLEALKALIQFEQWPPYYKSICRNAECARIGQRDKATALSLDFTVLEFNPAGESLLGDFSVGRASGVMLPYQQTVTKLPSIECSEPPSPF